MNKLVRPFFSVRQPSLPGTRLVVHCSYTVCEVRGWGEGVGLLYWPVVLQLFDINVKANALLVKEAHPHLTASG